MPRFSIPGTRYFSIATTLFAAFVFLFGSARSSGQTDIKTPASGAQNEVPFQLKATSNLVVVRVVVRDAQGKPVENLKKEDFKLFDRGKEQSLEQFEVVTRAAPVANFSTTGPASAAPPPAMPGRFIAFYFDTLNTSDSDIIQARDAADHYLSANLQPQDRVAIFTADEMLSDFTSDSKQIHEALTNLRASVRNVSRTRNCPDLSDYQALQITQNQNQNSDAWQTALNEAATCEGGVLSAPTMPSGAGGGGSMQSSESPNNPSFLATVIRTLAQTIVSQIDGQARANLQELEHAVKYTSQMPGERSVILVSPGFLSQNEQYQVDRLIDHALRSQVVISSLDPQGLAILMSETDASRSNVPANNPPLMQAGRRSESERELVSTAVLADVAYGTGGEFFHNNNDLTCLIHQS
jgi:VWFA-related protein